MMQLFLLFLFLLPSAALAAGNETINIIPDSNKSTFRVDSQNFWKNEIPNILHRYMPKDFVYSGGIHATSGSCTSPAFSLEAFTNAGNRITADGAGGSVSINYGASNIGGNCANDTCWVAGSSSDATSLPGSNFQRVGTSNIYVDCASTGESIWPPDTVKLMRVTLSGGAITSVVDLRGSSSPSSVSGNYIVTDPLFGAVCDGVTDATVGIQKALDTVPQGGKVVLPEGACILSAPLTISRPLSLYGSGMDQSFLKQATPNVPVLKISSVNVFIEGFTAMHLGTPVTGGDGIIVRAPSGESLQSVNMNWVSASWNARGFVLGCMAYAQAAHVVALKNNSHGFEFIYEDTPGCGVDQWDLIHANATLNKGVGFFGHNTTYAFGLGPWITQSISFGNNQGGYIFLGSPGHPINDLRFQGLLSSSDNVAGIFLDTYGGSHIINDSWIEYTGALAGFPIGTDNAISVKSNSGHCLGVTANNGSTTISGGVYWNCSWSGIAVDAPFASIMGGSSMGNGQALDPLLSRRAGVHIGATGIHLSGHTFTFPGSTTLHYIHFSGTILDLAVGINTYSPDLSPSNYVVSEATITGARQPQQVAGLTVHTNTTASPYLQIYDATQGVNPLKSFRVAAGNLQILNSAGSAVIQGISDVGTPSWPSRRGQFTISGVNLSANVGLTPNEPDNNYFVIASAVGSVGGPAAVAFTVTTVTKFTTGFEVIVVGPPGAGKSVTFDYFVQR